MHRGAVALVPMVDEQHVCLIENHRYSVGKTLIEVPAGTIDEGETPEQTAGASSKKKRAIAQFRSAGFVTGTSRRAS